MLFQPGCLLSMSQENLLMAIFRKCKEGHMMEAWGFFHTNSSDVSQATLNHSLWADRSKNWEIWVL